MKSSRNFVLSPSPRIKYVSLEHWEIYARVLVQISLLSVIMGTKVKGILRGFKYISQIFDEKEPEMEIGFPTDVKHVAHIGWEGPSASPPSWMDGFKGTAELANPADPQPEVKSPSTNPAPEDYTLQSEKSKPKSRRPPSAGSGSPARKSSTDAPRSSRRQHSGSSSADSPVSSPRGSGSSRHSRRRRSGSNVSMDSPIRDTDGSGKSSKQYQPSNLGPESPARDPSIPKHSRGKKSKGSSSSNGSVKSKSKERSSSREAAGEENGREGGESTKETM